jgi:hypothetical protein
MIAIAANSRDAASVDFYLDPAVQGAENARGLVPLIIHLVKLLTRAVFDSR